MPGPFEIFCMEQEISDRIAVVIRLRPIVILSHTSSAQHSPPHSHSHADSCVQVVNMDDTAHDAEELSHSTFYVPRANGAVPDVLSIQDAHPGRSPR